jgi:hypothetical protein
LRRSYSGGGILLPNTAQQVDGRGVKAVGGGESIAPLTFVIEYS